MSIPITEHDQDEIFTYEEVEKCYPKIGRYRPIVLVGPPGVGRNELRKRLTATNTNHFKSTIPCEYKDFLIILMKSDSHKFVLCIFKILLHGNIPKDKYNDAVLINKTRAQILKE